MNDLSSNIFSVELLRYTDRALDLLLETKGTRLSSDVDVTKMTEEERQAHLDYMKDTIKSSWEFVDYTFKITQVTRAFTHQLVRTRTGTYAQQAMRVADVREQPVDTPPNVTNDPRAAQMWHRLVNEVIEGYGELLDHGIAPQDARGILPTNMTTSIIAKFNLRTLHDMGLVRLCTRTQGEYQSVFRAMRAEVLRVHPWAEGFIEANCVQLGVCAFPRYGKTECPVYLPEMDNSAVRRAAKERWEGSAHEASPIAKGGMAQ